MTITNDITAAITSIIDRTAPDKVIAIADDNTIDLCLPHLSMPGYIEHHTIVVPHGDEHKAIDTVQSLWDRLMDCGATRHSLTLNIGGGMVTDIGGFAAATYMRGIPFVNIPTTLLATVDASAGGKTGINYRGMKNQIGVFASPVDTVFYPPFLHSLPFDQILSGYAEMVKHALIADKQLLNQTLAFDLDTWSKDSDFTTLIERSIAIKADIVAADPNEHGQRQALNFGHTIGHALEAWSHETAHPLPHGYAVMWGMVAELYLSMITLDLDDKIVRRVTAFARHHYPTLPLSCKQYDRLFDLMLHDKKNHHNQINFCLLSDIGHPTLNQTPTHDQILEALDFLQ